MKAMRLILLALAVSPAFTVAVAIGQEVPEPEISQKDNEEASRLYHLAQTKAVRSLMVLEVAEKHYEDIEDKEEEKSVPAEQVLRMKQQYVRMIDEVIALRDEYDVLNLKACRLLRMPDYSFNRIAISAPVRAAFMAEFKDVRATMAQVIIPPGRGKVPDR